MGYKRGAGGLCFSREFDMGYKHITYQSGLSSTLNAIQSKEEWWGIRAFFLVVVTMGLYLFEDERDTVFRLVINYLGSHLVASLSIDVWWGSWDSCRELEGKITTPLRTNTSPN